MALQIRAKLSPKKDFAFGIVGIIGFIALWCLLSYSGYVKPIFLPSPTGVWEGMQFFLKKDWLVPAILQSTWRVMQALFLAVAIGVPLGCLMGSFSSFDALLRKPINAGKAIPPTGLIGLIILWFSIEEKAKIIFLLLGSVFYMTILSKNAILNVRDEYVATAVDLGAKPWQILFKVLLPGALPQIWEAIAICNSIMWTYIILAEYINSNQEHIGLGYLLQIGTRTQESGLVYCALILIALVSTTSDWCMQWIKGHFLNW